ncbi:helix-turn-helix domain-containing protein [Marivirga harenae]|uniref:helix-turn-helix domain-containing protein n=1 Tax=Marivirga harenae TaxID=2010992 RepID=UPI00349EE4CD
MNIQKKIGKRVAELRRELNLSQEQLAAKTDLHEDYIGKIERGERSPSVKRLEIIIKSLNSSFKDFFKNFS